MKMNAAAAFSVTGWDEKTWDGQPAASIQGEKLTLALVSYTYSGDLSGQSRFEYLMTYRADGSGVFVGLERIEGSLLGRSGAFILEHRGTFEGSTVRGEAVVVPGSGSGELQGLNGQARIELSGHMPEYPIHFELEQG